jgi:uncharacterized cysteine cluster protein YcgN (CxxCxxCC family)
MSHEEWDSLCDGCGLCCRLKEEDEETGEVTYTQLVCRLLDTKTCRCRDYANRFAVVPECISLTPDNVGDILWLPSSCAYRLLTNGCDLPAWHPLVTGDSESAHRAGFTIQDRVISENAVNYSSDD